METDLFHIVGEAKIHFQDCKVNTRIFGKIGFIYMNFFRYPPSTYVHQLMTLKYVSRSDNISIPNMESRACTQITSLVSYCHSNKTNFVLLERFCEITIAHLAHP